MEKAKDQEGHKKEFYKEKLRQRMFFAIGTSILVNFFLMSGVLLLTNLRITRPLQWLQNTWNVISCLRMWTCFLVFSVVVFCTGVICSKDYLDPTFYACSRFHKLRQLFTLRKLSVVGLYSLLGGTLAWVHLSVEGGRYGSLIVYCKDSNSWCLVEEYYFLVLEGFWIGMYFFTRPRRIEFPIISIPKLAQVRQSIVSTIPRAAVNAIWPTLYFMGFYFLFGGFFRNILAYPLSLSIEEIRLLNVGLLFYAWLHGILFQLVTQAMHLLFQAYLTEWIAFRIESIEKTNLTLSEALAIDDIPIIKQLGYLDLVTVAQKDKLRRSALFTLSIPGGHPYNWNNVIEKSYKLINKFSKDLDAACASQIEKNKDIGRIDPLMSESQIPEKPYAYHMRKLVPASPAPMKSELKVDEPKLAENFLTQYYKNLKKSFVNYLLSKPLISYLFGELFESKLKSVFEDAQAVIWAVEAVSSLAVFSLKEDSYGVVQKDLTGMIEVLLKLKQSLDKLQKLNISVRKPISDDKYLKQTLLALKSATKSSIYRITCNFKKYIDDLGLSNAIADQLQPFLTYKE